MRSLNDCVMAVDLFSKVADLDMEQYNGCLNNRQKTLLNASKNMLFSYISSLYPDIDLDYWTSYDVEALDDLQNRLGCHVYDFDERFIEFYSSVKAYYDSGVSSESLMELCEEDAYFDSVRDLIELYGFDEDFSLELLEESLISVIADGLGVNYNKVLYEEISSFIEEACLYNVKIIECDLISKLAKKEPFYLQCVGPLLESIVVEHFDVYGVGYYRVINDKVYLFIGYRTSDDGYGLLYPDENSSRQINVAAYLLLEYISKLFSENKVAECV